MLCNITHGTGTWRHASCWSCIQAFMHLDSQLPSVQDGPGCPVPGAPAQAMACLTSPSGDQSGRTAAHWAKRPMLPQRQTAVLPGPHQVPRVQVGHSACSIMACAAPEGPQHVQLAMPGPSQAATKQSYSMRQLREYASSLHVGAEGHLWASIACLAAQAETAAVSCTEGQVELTQKLNAFTC